MVTSSAAHTQVYYVISHIYSDSNRLYILSYTLIAVTCFTFIIQFVIH